jgi:E3 ubiquitin-protein ligase EDD1
MLYFLMIFVFHFFQNQDESATLLSSSTVRILPRDQLQIIKGGMLPRVPDCFQRTPKKVTLQNQVTDTNVQILAIMVDGQGVHAVVRSDSSKLSHRIYNLTSGKIEVDSKFPTDTSAFLGLNPATNIRFHSTGENEFVSLLLDGNQTVYPLIKDSTPTADSIKDPQWVDLPPLKAVGLGTHALPHVGSGKKNEVAVMVLAFSPQTAMPKILQCDLEAVKRTVASLEADPTSIFTLESVQAIIDERCDGGRNIFHCAVSMCQPTSNKDSDQDLYAMTSSSPANFASSFDPVESVTSRAMNLRDMMRRAAAASR